PPTRPRTGKPKRNRQRQAWRELFPLFLWLRRLVMFEKIGRLAEAAATNVSVSRRGVLGRAGRGGPAGGGGRGGGAGVARPPGGRLSVAGPVQAGKKPPGAHICCSASYCSPPAPGCVWTSEFCGYYLNAGTCWWNCNGTMRPSTCSKNGKK